MKLIIYDDENKVIQMFEKINQVEVEGNNITWSTGSAKGINANYIIVDDNIEVTDGVTNDLISLDQKGSFKKIDLIKENAELRARVETAELALITLMDMM